MVAEGATRSARVQEEERAGREEEDRAGGEGGEGVGMEVVEEVREWAEEGEGESEGVIVGEIDYFAVLTASNSRGMGES